MKKISFALALALMCATASAQMSSDTQLLAYSPQMAAGDQLLAMTACQRADVVVGGRNLVSFQCGKNTLEGGQQTLKLIAENGKRFRIAGSVNELGPITSVHELDLNADKTTDYLVEFGSQSKQLVFITSNNATKGYDWQMIPHLQGPSTSHLFKDAEGKKLLLTIRLAGDAARKQLTSQDGVKRAYLVYDVVQFSNQSNQFLYAPTDNFPVWVAYENQAAALPGSLHRPTPYISRELIRKHTRAPLDKQRGGRMQPLG